jgi:hypothetical protein
MIRQITVYCASSSLVDPKYFKAAREMADVLVDHGVAVVFGGGGHGLMGCLADRVVERGGRIVGVMPHFMREVEWNHKRLDETVFVDDMHERKKRLLQDSDALIALPEGCGTMEELLEAITLKRLGQFTRPIVILNTDGFYDPLLDMLDRSIREHFMNERHRSMWSVIHRPAELMDVLVNAPAWDNSAIDFAVVK